VRLSNEDSLARSMLTPPFTTYVAKLDASILKLELSSILLLIFPMLLMVGLAATVQRRVCKYFSAHHPTSDYIYITYVSYLVGTLLIVNLLFGTCAILIQNSEPATRSIFTVVYTLCLMWPLGKYMYLIKKVTRISWTRVSCACLLTGTVVVSTLALLSIAATPFLPPAPPTSALRIWKQRLRVDAEDKNISISQGALAAPPKLTDVEARLGRPTRMERGANTVYIWDDLGVCVYERPFTGKIGEITVTLGANSSTLWRPREIFRPSQRFRGSLTFDGVDIILVGRPVKVSKVIQDFKGKGIQTSKDDSWSRAGSLFSILLENSDASPEVIKTVSIDLQDQ
jgi:hypothetical protein